jgi:hypothetical protein
MRNLVITQRLRFDTAFSAAWNSVIMRRILTVIDALFPYLAIPGLFLIWVGVAWPLASLTYYLFIASEIQAGPLIPVLLVPSYIIMIWSLETPKRAVHAVVVARE